MQNPVTFLDAKAKQKWRVYMDTNIFTIFVYFRVKMLGFVRVVITPV